MTKRAAFNKAPSAMFMSLFTLLVGPHALADTLFYCQTQSGKQIEVQDVAGIIHYRFGEKLYEPELALTVPRDLASSYQWIGAGSNEYYSVSIPNESIIYRVFTSRERKPDGLTESGVDVVLNGKNIATILCSNDTVYQQLMAVDLKAQE